MFDVTADAYAGFMGRYSEPLAVKFVDFADVRPGHRALDVGCGPGALTSQLVERLGAAAVTAIDPSAPFVAAMQSRFPDVDVHSGAAEHLPFPDASFDAALAQLVVHFMADPVTGLAEMARVTHPGGVVASSVWDHASERGPLSTFHRAARELDPDAEGESGLAGATGGQLVEFSEAAGMTVIESTALTVNVRHASFAEWWEPYTFGVGPAGAYVAKLDSSRREELRLRCEAMLGPGPFEISASAWCVKATVQPR